MTTNSTHDDIRTAFKSGVLSGAFGVFWLFSVLLFLAVVLSPVGQPITVLVDLRHDVTVVSKLSAGGGLLILVLLASVLFRRP